MSFIIQATPDGGTTSLDEPVCHDCNRLEGTPQQEDFFGELLTGSGNVLLEARAGTGKSASCREGMWRLLDHDRGLSIRYCCFNKKIAEEFKAKCPPGVEVGTMHSFGLRALQKALGSVQIEKNKSYVLLDATPGTSKLPRWMRRTITQVVSIAKNHNLNPKASGLPDILDDLILHFDVETWKRDTEVVDWACEVLDRSLENTALIDFDDMLWLPSMLQTHFPSIDYLFVDECQDLNATQHALVPLMNPSGRTVVTGDPYQAIYMWRGAAANSIALLRDQLQATTMPLTVTWRCPRLHVELARRLVADFEAAPNAPEGEVFEAPPDAIEAAPLGSLVLCRTNAPIIKACLRMLSLRRRAAVRGRALGDQLGAIVRRIEAATIVDLSRGIQAWKCREIERLERRDGTEDLIEAVTDKAAALTAICETCSSPAEVPDVIGMLFSDDSSENRITFSSVHRAKGSEAPSVYYIQGTGGGRRKPQDWELQQSRNIEYVALTRSLSQLTLTHDAN